MFLSILRIDLMKDGMILLLRNQAHMLLIDLCERKFSGTEKNK